MWVSERHCSQKWEMTTMMINSIPSPIGKKAGKMVGAAWVP